VADPGGKPRIEWRTEIGEVTDSGTVVRGYDLDELVGSVSFTEMAYLVVVGELPSPEQARMLDALLVSLTEHGVSPSAVVARMLTSHGSPLQAALAGGALTIGDWHGGAGERLAETLASAVAESDDAEQLRRWLRNEVAARRRAGERIEGFGHPQHSDGDPRAVALLGLAEALGVAGRHSEALAILGEEVSTSLGRSMPPNVNGAVAAIALDLGFPWASIRGLVIAPRSIGLTAHVVEEREQAGRWRRANPATVTYEGHPARALPRDPT
jgi:citrate synthase